MAEQRDIKVAISADAGPLMRDVKRMPPALEGLTSLPYLLAHAITWAEVVNPAAAKAMRAAVEEYNRRMARINGR